MSLRELSREMRSFCEINQAKVEFIRTLQSHNNFLFSFFLETLKKVETIERGIKYHRTISGIE